MSINNHCRYILKPPVLRNALATPFTIFERHKLENVVPSKITLKVSYLSALLGLLMTNLTLSKPETLCTLSIGGQ